MAAGSNPAWVSNSAIHMKQVLGLSWLFLLKRLSCCRETIAVLLVSSLPASLETVLKRCAGWSLQVRT